MSRPWRSPHDALTDHVPMIPVERIDRTVLRVRGTQEQTTNNRIYYSVQIVFCAEYIDEARDPGVVLYPTAIQPLSAQHGSPVQHVLPLYGGQSFVQSTTRILCMYSVHTFLISAGCCRMDAVSLINYNTEYYRSSLFSCKYGRLSIHPG